MEGLMMDYQLNVPAILRRADELYGDNEIASRLPDKSWHRYTYADFVSRTKKLTLALRGLGLEDGDRVGTFMWNHSQHLETYMGAPVGGFVTHTLNLRLHPDDNTYIATHGGDRVIVVDKVLWPLAEQFVGRCNFEHVIAVGDGPTPDGAIDYEELLADTDESAFSYRDIPERSAAAMCYTSGTTGRPKGVLYSHRAIAIHALTAIGCLGMYADDVCLPVVPMFHANAWCFPFSCTMTGVKQVLPGPHLDPVEPARGLPAGAGHHHCRRPDDLDGDPPGPRRQPGRMGSVGHAHDDGRRRGAAARDDRSVLRAARPAHHARVGDDRDEPDRDALGRSRPGDRPLATGGVRPARDAGAADSLRRDPRPRRRRAHCPGTARRWASSRCAAPRSPRPTTSRTRAPIGGRTTAGSRRATSSRSTPTASSRCRTVRRTS